MKYYLCAYITLISSILGIGFSIGAIAKETGKNKENALYMLARSIALMVIAVIPVCMEVKNILILITAAMLIVQIIDGLIGIYIKDKMRTGGPFVMALFHAISLLIYLR